MHLRTRARVLRTMAAAALVGALLGPAAVPVTAQEGNVLRVGTGQDLDAMNPYQTALVVGFEVFTLNYELLVGFGQDLKPIPGFASEWTVSDDGLQYTFTIPEGKLWSDGQPATADDVEFSIQLALDAIASDAGALCLGYIDPYLVNAAVSGVEATDPQTVVVTLDRPNERILATYVPILPRHIWESKAATICDDQFATPIVGSGPYQAQEWQTGQFVRFAKNPNWIGPELAADEVVMQFFETEDTMAQALRNGELDYAQNLLSDQFDQLQGVEDITTVAGTANGFTELGFNTYGTGTGNTIEGGGPSTPALLDPVFRDALGYAIDKELLVERVLGGYGEPGTTQVPPFQAQWHKEPDTVRTFDIAEADRRLTAAGYTMSGDQRLDKEGNPIVLDLVFPDSDTTYATSAQFIQEWWGQLGIAVNPTQYDSDTLIDLMLPPEADPEADYKADYDLFIWGWGGDVDPNSLLEIFTCDQIGSSSDSNYCNPEYDTLFQQQNEATSPEDRKALMDQMQEIMYDEAPYHILYYDAALHAYRTDRFTNWVNQPDNGTPLFGYGPYGYTQLQLVGAEPSPSVAPSDGASPSAGTSPSPSAAPTTPDGSTGDSTPLILAIVGIVVIAGAAVLFMRRRGGSSADEE